MTTEEIEERGGVVLLKPEYVNRGNHVENRHGSHFPI